MADVLSMNGGCCLGKASEGTGHRSPCTNEKWINWGRGIWRCGPALEIQINDLRFLKVWIIFDFLLKSKLKWPQTPQTHLTTDTGGKRVWEFYSPKSEAHNSHKNVQKYSKMQQQHKDDEQVQFIQDRQMCSYSFPCRNTPNIRMNKLTV